LRCANRLIGSQRATDHDILSAAAIVAIDGPLIEPKTILEDVPQTGDRPPRDMDYHGGQPDPGPLSPDITTEVPQEETPFVLLCGEVLQRLITLRHSDFTDTNSYIELRQFLYLDVPAIECQQENSSRRGGMFPLWTPQ
jgi:hypothetical protein